MGDTVRYIPVPAMGMVFVGMGVGNLYPRYTRAEC